MTEIRRGLPFESGEKQAELRIQKLAAMAEPTGRPQPGRLEEYARIYEKYLVTDPRLFGTRVRPRWQAEGGVLMLEGHAQFPQNADAAERLFRAIGFETIENRLVTPDTKVECARIVAETALVYGAPAEPREVMTTWLENDNVFVLHAGGSVALCAGWDGYVGFVDLGALGHVSPAAMEERLRTVPHPIAVAALEEAKTYLGTKYRWGGKTHAGIDCSGLVQAAWAAQGVCLPRDTTQLVHVGALVALAHFQSALQPGDLIFFIGTLGTITHTAIYAGDEEYIESDEEVRMSSLNPEAPNFRESRGSGFAFGKRLFFR